uniref:Transient receptor potential cation channel subfamily M member 4 n=1 Tax=Dicentrarchus labrax TaxID=13489 RepID=A0A8P4K4J3_DICLA
MTAHWGLPLPNLVVSVVGGEGHEKIKTWVRDVLRNGLVRAAQSTGAWILTGGLREGISRCVGEAVRDHGAAAPALSRKKVIAVGLAPWGLVHNRQQLVQAQVLIIQLDASLRKATPWLVLAGSGPAADLISELLGNLSSASLSPTSPPVEGEAAEGLSPELRDRVREKIQKYFPAEADKRVSSEASEYTEELKLAVAWNRVDIAKTELFNGDIQWKYEDLEDSMTDALINDKPQFVRLFCENGLNILDYLTYRRLESLYHSLSDSSLAYVLLQRRLSERQGLAGSLYNVDGDVTVSRLLWDLLGDVCQPFYYGPLGLDHSIINKMLLGECMYRDQRCLSPWAALFIWAVLQNRSDMAVYFWEMAGESVLSALGGCKILRELSKLESETENKLAMKELAQKFENLAHDVFGECYQSSENRSFTLLIRKSPVWGGATCLQMAIAADARLFFSHDGVQSLLSQIWWGDMERSTEVWKLVLTFFLPPLLYTNLMSFRDQEEEVKSLEVNHIRDNESLDGNDATVFSLRPFIVSRWRQFWFAPVTSFLGNVLMYFLFLCLFAYVLLVDFKPPPPHGPSTLEFVLYFWVFTLVCEEIRQTFFVGGNFVIQRMRNYIQDVWNKCDLTAIALFTLALCCRMFPWSYQFGRAVMAIDYMVFTLRLIHIFAIHKQLGPKIIIVGKMMKDVFFFLFFLAVWLTAYGVANQALLYSYDPRPNWILRRVFYRPYLHIFGQIPINEMDADKLGDMNCTNDTTRIEAGEEPCMNTNANWLVVILLVIYLLFTNIVLVNLLIAMFSYTFSKVQEHSDTYWKFQRYNLIVEYHSRPCLAPPFIIISHLHLFIKRYIRRIPSVKSKHFGEKLQVEHADRKYDIEGR